VNNNEGYLLQYPVNYNSFFGETLTITIPWNDNTPAHTFSALPMIMPSVLNAIAERYMHENPGVYIEVRTLANDPLGVHERIELELMSGQADILLDMSYTPWRTNAAQNFFADWLPIMHSDPRFNENDYFTNVFNAIMINDSMYAFPVSFNFTHISANLNVPGLYNIFAQYNTVSLRDLQTMHDLFSTNQSLYILPLYGVIEVVRHNLSNFLDINTRFVNFNSPDFINLISQTREFSTGIWNRPPYNLFPITPERELHLSNTYLFNNSNGHNLFYLICDEQAELFKGSIPLTSENDELIIQIFNGFVLNENATAIQRALAWDFVQFFMKPENRSGLQPVAQAVYKPLFLHQTQWLAQAMIDMMADGSFSINMNQSLDSNQDDVLDRVIEQVIERLYKFGEMPMIEVIPRYRNISAVITNVLIDFHDGIITAEQAATDIQNRVSLLIMELGI